MNATEIEIENQTDDSNTTNELLSLTSKIKAHTIATLIDLALPRERCIEDILKTNISNNPEIEISAASSSLEMDSEKITEKLQEEPKNNPVKLKLQQKEKSNSPVKEQHLENEKVQQENNLMPLETDNEETIEKPQETKNNHLKLKSQNENRDFLGEQEEDLENNRTQENKSIIEASPISRSPRKSPRISRQTADSISQNGQPENEISQKPRFLFKIGSNLRSPRRSKGTVGQKI